MLGRFVFIDQPNKLNQEIAGTWVYLSHLPNFTSILFPSHIKHTAGILNSLENTWLTHNISSRSNPHLITYTTLDVPSGLPSATSNRIIILTCPAYIDFQLGEMAPKGSHQGKTNKTARAKMPTSVINQHLSLDRDRMQKLILEHIRGPMRRYNAHRVKDEMACGHFYHIMFCDPVITHHFSQFQLM